ncbi:putative Queuine/other tRNA-ribosyltransferase [Paratrimastix pyriformis]|uniref:Queuine tRNA-ribosyltransferase accessory subunit 2 n=1 Tax=Paratrimastix pyriformis TaxID=342808 RepID=A0ABQ8UHU0_9EUKA|nr:putative Queuine/other tRNA-ribosyltransferase [Paratrimastix pyriformis]
MNFQVAARAGLARTGTLHTPHGDLATPGCLMATMRGIVPHLAKDVLSRIPYANGLEIYFAEMLESEGFALLERFGVSAHTHLNATQNILCLSLRNAMVYNLDGPANDNRITVSGEGGKHPVNAELFARACRLLQPDFACAMADEPVSTCSRKRAGKAVTTTGKYLDAILAQGDLKCPLFGVVAGGSSPEERVRSAELTATRPVAGFLLGGFGLGETPQERDCIFPLVMAKLPAEKPRMIAGLGTPVEVMQAVANGVDVFSSAYPLIESEAGNALVFPLSPSSQESDPFKLNMRSGRWELEQVPLVAGCGCYTCQRHTRAYVRHLLNTHEMTGDILLMIHNAYHYLQFFAAIRECISADASHPPADGAHSQFEQLRQRIVASMLLPL